MSAPGLEWDGWREVSAEEYSAAIDTSVARRWFTEAKNYKVEHHYFVADPPLPANALGMCANRHVMVRSRVSVDGWKHGDPPCDYDLVPRVVTLLYPTSERPGPADV